MQLSAILLMCYELITINWLTAEPFNTALLKFEEWDFPGGAVVKNPPANAGDTGSIPGLVRSHMSQSN